MAFLAEVRKGGEFDAETAKGGVSTTFSVTYNS